MMQSSLITEAPAVQPRRTTKTLFLALVGVSAVCACLFHSGVLSAPVTGSSAAAEYVQSPLEQEVGQEIAAMAAQAQRIMSDPKKVQLLARRIRELFQDAKFVEKMQMEMAKLQNDEELYAWLAMTQGAPQEPRRLASAFQVQPSAFRGAPATRAPAAQMQFSLPQFGGNGGKPAKGKAFTPAEFAATLPGIIEPLGFFDPAGFCANDASPKPASEGKVRFYREVELKHCRVAMLAALGFPLAEQFHPLFGGDIDTPSFDAFQQTPLQTFWPIVVFAIAIPEIYSVFTFQPAGVSEPWSIRTDHEAGDLEFDPLGLKPTDPAELKEMQTNELNTGRLAMIGIAGMIIQEGVTGGKLF
jgi:hypothetical protein